MSTEPNNSRAVKSRMNPNRFVIGERVQYQNHVAGYDIALLEVTAIDGDTITAKRFFGGGKLFTFNSDGIATYSPNLSIKHTGETHP